MKYRITVADGSHVFTEREAVIAKQYMKEEGIEYIITEVKPKMGFWRMLALGVFGAWFLS